MKLVDFYPKGTKVIWKSLSVLANYNFGDRYIGTNLGDVFRVKELANGAKLFKKMSPFRTRDGYLEFVLTDENGIKRHIQGQRIIAGIFLKQDKIRTYVNHKNGQRDDNRLENLEYVSHSENLKHSYRELGRVPWNKKFHSSFL